MAQFDPSELDDPDDLSGALDPDRRRDLDGVAALRDVEAEAGDDDESADTYDMDDREAQELGVRLDGRNEPEPGLD